MDDLLADAQSILRLKVTRKAMSAASRACAKTAEERRIQQLVHPTRTLRIGASAVILSTTAAYFRTSSRWGGYRSRYRRSQVVKRPVQLGPVARQRHGRLATIRKLANDQFAWSLRRANEMRTLGGWLPARGLMRPPRLSPFGNVKLPRLRSRK
jgi:hypothetical protein